MEYQEMITARQQSAINDAQIKKQSIKITNFHLFLFTYADAHAGWMKPTYWSGL